MSVRYVWAICILLFSGYGPWAWAGGISVDAGLTPAQSQFLFRIQLRYQSLRSLSSNEHINDRFSVPLVAAYGLRPGMTLLLRNQYSWYRSYEEGNVEQVRQGLEDPLLMTKLKVLRKNTRHYILGMSPTIGVFIPVGHNKVSANTWRGQVGWFVSFRKGSWAIDINTAYRWLDYKVWEGKRWFANAALAYHFSLDEAATTTVAPVGEVNYSHRLNTTDQRHPFFAGLGGKLTINSFVLEGLAQWPLKSYPMARPGPRWLAGVRLKL